MAEQPKEIPLGSYVLHVGGDGGSKIRLVQQTPADEAAKAGGGKALRKALAKADKDERKRSKPELLESATDEASAVTAKVERAKTLCTQVMSGEVSLESISSETDALVGLLGRLDRAGRFEEELRLAKCVSTLLSLARRWVELLRSLKAALHAAEQLDDMNGKAWVLHELGTLRLAADDHAGADELLGQARELRERCGDRRGLAVTERNLQVLCRSLRTRLHRRRRSNRFEEALRRPVLALAAAGALVLVGGSAGAMIGHSKGSHRAGHTTPTAPYGPGRRLATVTVSFSPLEPHAGEPVTFRATATDRSDPVVSYRWDFGDHDPSVRKRTTHTHVYSRAGTFKLVLLVRDAQRRTIGEASASIYVLPKSGGGHGPGPKPPPKPQPGEAPIARFTVQPRSPLAGESVTFDASESAAATGSIARYEWDLGDGPPQTGVSVRHVYTSAKPYQVTLTVTDRGHKADTQTRTVTVREEKEEGQPSPELTLTCPPSVPFGGSIGVSGTLTPPQAEVAVHLTFIGPSKERMAGAEATTDASGSFSSRGKFKAINAGTWTVRGEADSEGAAGHAEGECETSVEPRGPTYDFVPPEEEESQG